VSDATCICGTYVPLSYISCMFIGLVARHHPTIVLAVLVAASPRDVPVSQTRLGARRRRWRARTIPYLEWARWAFATRWQSLKAPGLLPPAMRFWLSQPDAFGAGATVHLDVLAPTCLQGGGCANWGWDVN
jgi:hypothetical protein